MLFCLFFLLLFWHSFVVVAFVLLSLAMLSFADVLGRACGCNRSRCKNYNDMSILIINSCKFYTLINSNCYTRPPGLRKLYRLFISFMHCRYYYLIVSQVSWCWCYYIIVLLLCKKLY